MKPSREALDFPRPFTLQQPVPVTSNQRLSGNAQMMIRTLLCFAVVLPATLASQAPTNPTKGTGTVVLKAARLIDGTGAAPIQNGVVVVTDDKIVAVGAAGSVSVPAGARTIDLGNA